MKKILLYTAGLMLVLSSCKKSDSTPQSKILKAYNSGYLYNTWIINDENDIEQTQTKNSEMFINKFSPKILIKKDKTYSFTYKTPYSKTETVTETGTWSFDNVDMLVFKGDPFTDNTNPKFFGKTVSYDYTFQITKFTEEELVLDRTFNRSTTTSEGKTVTDNDTSKETLYMEDND